MKAAKTTQNPAFKTLLQGLQMEDALDRLEVSLEATKQQNRKAQEAVKEAQLEAKIAEKELKEAQLEAKIAEKELKETQLETKIAKQELKETQQKTKAVFLKIATYLIAQNLPIDEIVLQTGLTKTEIQELKQSN